MGASSSSLLDEGRISHIKGLIDNTFRRFSGFYRQQYSAAYIAHLHQEVELKRDGRILLLKHRPHYDPEEVLYQESVKVCLWDEQGRSRERYTVLRREHTLEIHESMETFRRGCAAKLVLQPLGATVVTTEEASKALLEQSCPGIFNGVKEDSSSVVPSPDVFSAYLHMPYTGHTCFLFVQEENRDRFVSALKTCIRHCNLDPWLHSSYESQAYVQALRLYRQDRGCYESWEKLLGTEEQVLACQVMEEVLPWLQSQLHPRMKGKRTERIRLWMATVQVSYTLVLDELSEGLEALKGECRQTVSANQTLIRSHLDQIMASRSFLEDKVRACICGAADKLCRESIAPYLSSILEALTENISAGIQGIQHTLNTQMDAALTEKALPRLRSTCLDHCYRLLENLTEKLEDLKQRFGFSSTQRLVQCAHAEMEQLSDSAIYTLELFLHSSAKLQHSEFPVKLERAKERVLKQLEHDSRVVQRRFSEEALLEITLPAFTKRLDNTLKPELRQFEQYIFSDYSSFILVHDVYDDVLRDILRKEIERVLQEAVNKQSNSLLMDSSNLAISHYSLIGEMPPCSAPSSPGIHTGDSSSVVPGEDKESASQEEDGCQWNMADFSSESYPELDPNTKSALSGTHNLYPNAAFLSPIILVTHQTNESTVEAASFFKEPCEEVQIENNPDTDSITASSSSTTSTSNATITHLCSNPDLPNVPGFLTPFLVSPDPSLSPTVAPSECNEGDQSPPTESSEKADLPMLDNKSTSTSPLQLSFPSSSHPPWTDSPMKTSLASLSEAIGCSSTALSIRQTMVQQVTDRAVYLTGGRKVGWEAARLEEQKQGAEEKEEQLEREGGERNETIKEQKEGREAGDKRDSEREEEERGEGENIRGGKCVGHACRCSEPLARGTATSTETMDQREQDIGDHSQTGSELEGKKDADEGEKEERDKEDHPERGGNKEEELLQSSQPIPSQPESAALLPFDCVAVIRGLVTEVTEVEQTVLSCPNSQTA